MIRIPKNRPPTHPGEMLLKEYLEPMKISQRQLSIALNIPYQRVNEIVKGKRGVTPETDLLISKYFNITPGFWISLQQSWDLYFAQKHVMHKLLSIIPHPSVIE